MLIFIYFAPSACKITEKLSTEEKIKQSWASDPPVLNVFPICKYFILWFCLAEIERLRKYFDYEVDKIDLEFRNNGISISQCSNTIAYTWIIQIFISKYELWVLMIKYIHWDS